MTATAAQQRFNQYPSRPFKPDIWHRLPKIDKRENLKALVYVYLINGGQIERAPPKKSRGAGRPRIFGKDSRSAAYDRDTVRFLSGHDFTQSGPRWTSKPVRDDSASKRDATSHAGISHPDFRGAVTEINGRLRPRQVGNVIADTADKVHDSAKRATIRDELNLNAVDFEHSNRLKLAA